MRQNLDLREACSAIQEIVIEHRCLTHSPQKEPSNSISSGNVCKLSILHGDTEELMREARALSGKIAESRMDVVRVILVEDPQDPFRDMLTIIAELA